jgi:hypothetical protein
MKMQIGLFSNGERRNQIAAQREQSMRLFMSDVAPRLANFDRDRSPV